MDSFPSVLQLRQRGGSRKDWRPALHVPSSFIDRLVCSHSLQGHSGCVNRIAWNETGTSLASGSDDTCVGIFDYATGELRKMFETGHQRNIFGVRFLPGNGDRAIVTGAMDCEVRLHTAPFDRPSLSQSFECHAGRVKSVETAIREPNLFWSAGEDGMVRQYDVRLPRCGAVTDPARRRGGGGGGGGNALEHQGLGGAAYDSPNVLVQLGAAERGGGPVRAMGVAVSQMDSNLLALACGDHLTRLYDRRRLSLTLPQLESNNSSATPTLQSFCPPHLRDLSSRSGIDAHATSVAFSPDGREILANYHGDHVYSFPVNGCGSVPTAFRAPPGLAGLANGGGGGAAAACFPALSPAWEGKCLPAVGPKHSEEQPLLRHLNGSCAFRNNGSARLPGRENDVRRWLRRAETVGSDATDVIDTCGGAVLAAHRQLASAEAAANAEKGLNGIGLSEGAELREDLANVFWLRADALLARRWRGDAELALRDAAYGRVLRPENASAYVQFVKALGACGRKRQSRHEARRFAKRFPGEAKQVWQYLSPQSDEDGDFKEEESANDAEERSAAHAAASARLRSNSGARRGRVRSAGRAGGGGNGGGGGGDDGAGDEGRGGGGTQHVQLPAGGMAARMQLRHVGNALVLNVDWPNNAGGGQERSQQQQQQGGVQGGRGRERPPDRDVRPRHNPPPAAPIPPPSLTNGPPPPPAAAAAEMPPAAATAAAGAEMPPAGRAGEADEHEVVLGAVVVPAPHNNGSGGASPGDFSLGELLGGTFEEANAHVHGDYDLNESAGGREDVSSAAAAVGGAGALSGSAQSRARRRRSGSGASAGDGGGGSGHGGRRRRRRREEQELDRDEKGESGGGGSDLDSSEERSMYSDILYDDEDDLTMLLCRHLSDSTAFASEAFEAPAPGSGVPTSAGAAAKKGRGPCSALVQRFVGACNIHTDIKEAAYFGENHVVAGSDFGMVFVWERATGRLLRAWKADSDVVNCVAGHPTDPVLATSGIEDVVRLWAPTGELPADAAAWRADLKAVVDKNEREMMRGGGRWTIMSEPLMRTLVLHWATGGRGGDGPVNECAQS